MYTLLKLLPHFKYLNTIIIDSESEIGELAYDTRKIFNGKASLFFALVHQRDGHQYLTEAYAKGIRNFVVSDSSLDISLYKEANFVWVESALEALQEIAKYHRSQFSFPVIAITGSNGKTIVKQWLYQLLSEEFACYQSPKSYNSQLGVALSLWGLSSDYNLAIIEAGISQPGEMQNLAQMIKPTIGVFTSLGTAHREGFDSRSQKLNEKWILFDSVASIIAPSAYVLDKNNLDERILSWGYSVNDYVYVSNVTKSYRSTYVDIYFSGEKTSLLIPFVDQASIDNVLTCVTTMLFLGYTMDSIAQRVALLKPLEMRLKLKRGKNNSSIIDDSYSNDFASLQIALDFLNQQNQFKQKKLILSDFEGEEWNEKFEKKLIDLLQNANLSALYLVGDSWGSLKDRLSNVQVFESIEALYSILPQIDLFQSTVLIKGARKYQFERITSALVDQSHETVLEINLKAIEHNIQQYRSKLNPDVKLMAMVKAFSYGVGSFEVANILQFSKIDYLTVAFVDEGVALRKAGITLPIMVLSPHESTFEDLVRYQLEPEIYSIRIYDSFVQFLHIRGLISYPIHLKLDTGMHRLGFFESEIDDLLLKLPSQNEVKVISVFSHLVGVGDVDFLEFTRVQVNRFLIWSKRIQEKLGYSIIRHICNTSGIVHCPEAHLDMVRLGIGLYGFDMSPKDLSLEQVTLLKTTITQIKHLSKEETVGYDRKGILYRDSIIATVKIGYADGYNRRFGNGVGKMLINGNMAPTVGNICMDMCMLDITDIEAKEGDEVVVFPNVLQSSKDIGTIPYELLTGISSRVKRVYFYE